MAKSQYTHDAVATIGEYTDRNTGEKKKRYINVGKCFTDDSGRQSIKLDSIPVGPEWSGWISLYPAERRDAPQRPPERQATQQTSRPRNDTPGMPAAADARNDHDNDEIPF